MKSPVPSIDQSTLPMTGSRAEPTGAVPFTTGNILRAHLEQQPPDPRSLVSDLSDGVATFILSCLAKEPADRPRDGRALVAAVAGLYGGGRP